MAAPNYIFVFFFKSMVSEEETFKKIHKSNSPTSHLCVRAPKKVAFKFYFRKQILKTGLNFLN